MKKNLFAVVLIGLAIFLAGQATGGPGPAPAPSADFRRGFQIVRQLDDPQLVREFIQNRGIILPYSHAKPISVATVSVDPTVLLPPTPSIEAPPIIPPHPIGSPYRSIQYRVTACAKTGNDLLSSASGQGVGRLTIGVSENVKARFFTSVPVSPTVLSKGLGWEVTADYPIVGEFAQDIPAGQQWVLAAYPEYSSYKFTIWQVPLIGEPYPEGNGVAYRPIGFTVITFSL
ncbi:hypothetical protein [Kyrpidia tusciae]|uniref:Uncharacterized protein n=1 Tax=Kyrpidia tusciae (strain DSM 2912 / NBRC 15312 / T2) TaxID=562970 RepID=D5WRT3_KYRT2|nr:hypothetical protein [Kyrpidia tusciae]ADG06885.1 hypothetical protein Btus_2208 [Kyrpidia tusciae DSM 2912]